MVHSDSSLMLAGASCTIELNTISDDSYTLDKSVEDIKNWGELSEMENSFDRFIDDINRKRVANACEDLLYDQPDYETDPVSMYLNENNDNQIYQSSVVTVTAKETDDEVDKFCNDNGMLNGDTSQPPIFNSLPLIKQPIIDINRYPEDLVNSRKRHFNKQDHDTSILFVGDSTIRNMNIVNGEMKNQCFKVTKPGASITNLRETVKYLLKNRLKNVKTVVLQVGRNDFSNRLSEEVKRDFLLFIDDIARDNKHLIISGPVPSWQFSCEQFTRCLQVNEWLQNLPLTEGVQFIDNFDLFWRKKHLFENNGYVLTDLGALVLSNNIRINSAGTQML